MNINKHPESENILNFLDNPTSLEHDDIELHLAQCSNCRQIAQELADIQSDLRTPEFSQLKLRNDIADTAVFELDDSFDHKITDYLKNNLNHVESDKIEHLLDKNPHALKAALHYVSHQSAMQRELTESESGNSNSRSTDSFTAVFTVIATFRQLFKARTPAWLLLPVSGFAGLIVAILLSTQISHDNTIVSVASYQDNAVIEFSGVTKQPGIGFFEQARKTIKPFNNVTIELNDDSDLMFGWPVVANATSYTLAIYTIDQGRNVSVAKTRSLINSATFKNSKLKRHHHYQWILTGKTSTNKSFMTKGGFVSN